MADSDDIDGIRLSKTMAFLLRHRPEVGDLRPDGEGWVELEALLVALTRLLHVRVTHEVILGHLGADIRWLDGERAAIGSARFEVLGPRIRAVERPPGHAHPRVIPPDILYHAARTDQLPVARAQGLGVAGDPRRPVTFTDDEAAAWRLAWRLAGSEADPAVIVADAARARRRGVRFYRDRRTGLYLANHISGADLLNLLPGFEEQLSAGGIPVRLGAGGTPEFALIRVTRRSGVTWEVAKGKLEHGETPEAAALREVREEMGLETPMIIRAEVARVRYGFLAPGGLPRLKSVYLYLMALTEEAGAFRPAEKEGIGAVRWFAPDEAVRVVTHSSLLPAMRRARQIVDGFKG